MLHNEGLLLTTDQDIRIQLLSGKREAYQLELCNLSVYMSRVLMSSDIVLTALRHENCQG